MILRISMINAIGDEKISKTLHHTTQSKQLLRANMLFYIEFQEDSNIATSDASTLLVDISDARVSTHTQRHTTLRTHSNKYAKKRNALHTLYQHIVYKLRQGMIRSGNHIPNMRAPQNFLN